MNRLGFAMLEPNDDGLEELDAAAAGPKVEAALFTCIFFSPPRYEFETSCEHAQPCIDIARTHRF